jgi:hypothetical protein
MLIRMKMLNLADTIRLGQALSSAWVLWADQPSQQLPYIMDISGIIQSQGYDQRAVTSAALARANMAPQYYMPLLYGSTAISNAILPMINYLQRRSQSQMLNPPPLGLPSLLYSRAMPRQNYMPDQLRSTSSLENSNSSQYITATTVSTSPPEDVNFGADINILIKVIQSKINAELPGAPQNSPTNLSIYRSQAVESSYNEPYNDPKKRYKCYIGDCRKVFFQKMYLEIHIRAHTGIKPYVRPYPPFPLIHPNSYLDLPLPRLFGNILPSRQPQDARAPPFRRAPLLLRPLRQVLLTARERAGPPYGTQR